MQKVFIPVLFICLKPCRPSGLNIWLSISKVEFQENTGMAYYQPQKLHNDCKNESDMQNMFKVLGLWVIILPLSFLCLLKWLKPDQFPLGPEGEIME